METTTQAPVKPGTFLPTLVKQWFARARKVLRAVDHKLRQQILEYIGEEEKTVTDIYVSFREEQSVISQHLAILRDAGFVKTRRDGKYIYYSVHHENLRQYETLASQINAVK